MHVESGLDFFSLFILAVLTESAAAELVAGLNILYHTVRIDFPAVLLFPCKLPI